MLKTSSGRLATENIEDELPDEAITLDGFSYLPRLDHWIIVTATGRKHFRFHDLHVSAELITCCKRFAASLLLSENPISAYTTFQTLRYFLLHIGGYDSSSKEIMPAHLLNFRGSRAQKQLYRSTTVNYIVRLWAQLGIPGVSQAAFVTATEMPSDAPKRGLAVRLLDPELGAYTNLEFDGLHKALHAAFATGSLSLSNYGICLLSAALAPRPVQIASLRLCDLRIRENNGVTTYLLSVPRAKQGGTAYRSQFTDRPLIEDIGIVLLAQARIVRRQAEASGMDDPDQAPLFPAQHVNSTFYSDSGTPAAPTRASIGMRIINVMEALEVKSERTGKVINVNARRARRTLGTRAAQEGRTLEQIAQLLDHSSLTAARNYIEVSSKTLQNIDKKVANLLAPLAQRFVGSVRVKSDSQDQSIQKHVFGAGDGGAPTDIGGCGKFGFCGLGKPLACYTCRLFHPWTDGPHEEILESLLARRTRMAVEGSAIVAQSLDDTIVACAEVVRLCRMNGREMVE
ncbi:site-specific integrase [Neorhizobium sp. DAR64861/K0K2]|uniref:site-specific integrase n=1 Tax=Neorhizobium sp. DAR64861/K0K2 TaxID=3421956 RepID=UPI003D277C0D